MPQYKAPLAERAKALGDKATRAFDEALHDRRIGEDYVRRTVIQAAVPFLVAVGQRFQVRGVRLAVTGVAGAFLIYGVTLLIINPNARRGHDGRRRDDGRQRLP